MSTHSTGGGSTADRAAQEQETAVSGIFLCRGKRRSRTFSPTVAWHSDATGACGREPTHGKPRGACRTEHRSDVRRLAVLCDAGSAGRLRRCWWVAALAGDSGRNDDVYGVLHNECAAGAGDYMAAVTCVVRRTLSQEAGYAAQAHHHRIR